MGKKRRDENSRKGGRRKKGRNLKSCAAYRLSGRRERNRDRRAARIRRGFRPVETKLAHAVRPDAVDAGDERVAGDHG